MYGQFVLICIFSLTKTAFIRLQKSQRASMHLIQDGSDGLSLINAATLAHQLGDSNMTDADMNPQGQIYEQI